MAAHWYAWSAWTSTKQQWTGRSNEVVVGKIRSNKLETWAAREADGQLDWQKLFASQPGKPAKAPEPASARPLPTLQNLHQQRQQTLAVLLKDVQLRNYQVHLADRQAKPVVALELVMNVDMQNFDSLNISPSPSRSTAAWANRARSEQPAESTSTPSVPS